MCSSDLTPDEDLATMASRELVELGLIGEGEVEASYVVRMPKAYPVYDHGYQDAVEVIRKWIDTNVPNVHPVGRNGMHKYNNQDHSMLTAMRAVDNVLTDAGHDVWAVNVEEEYHEEDAAERSTAAGTGRAAPVLPRRAQIAVDENAG